MIATSTYQTPWGPADQVGYVPISTSSTSSTLVAAVPGSYIVILGFTLSASGSVNVKFQDGSPADITGLFYLTTGSMEVAPMAEKSIYGVCKTGTALNLILSSAVAVGGGVTYAVIKGGQ